MFDVANQYLKLENNQRAMDWFQKAHHTRHPTASIEIAKLFYYGKGTPKDLDQAKKYFKKGKYAAKDEVRDFLARIDKNEKTKTKRKKQDKSL
jgi:TPR repeat protein